MPPMNYAQARQRLQKACERYILHKREQLSTLTAESPIIPSFTFYERALGTETAGRGFYNWIACKYAYLFDKIAFLNKKENYCSTGAPYYEDNYPPCRKRTTYFDDTILYDNPDLVVSENTYLLDNLNVLNGLLLFIMIDENKEPAFEQKWSAYKADCKQDYDCSDSDPVSVQIYTSIMKLKSLISFVDTLVEYRPKSSFLIRELNTWFPTLDSYGKCLAVEELEAILDDATLNDEEALKAVALQLKNPITSELLEKNQQSDTEYLLKILSVILVIVAIGVIPTVCLASKRLYDTGGSSINFFKPLSKNLREDIDSVTADIPPSHPQQNNG
ncbi:MAG: hypothetical protein JJT82_02845 [Legionellaceae bacterium]|nr:hypothetical protein [Legionellaceae bacterium]